MDRHQLYQALFQTLGVAPLGALQACQGDDEKGGVGGGGGAALRSDSSGAGPAGGEAERVNAGGGRQQQRRRQGGKESDGGAEAWAEGTPLDVLLARTAGQMLNEQVRQPATRPVL